MVAFICFECRRNRGADCEGRWAPNKEMANEWQIFEADYQPGPESLAVELDARGNPHRFQLELTHNTGVIKETVPTFLLPDAFVMMLIGMALYRLGVLQGQRSVEAYRNLLRGFTWAF